MLNEPTVEKLKTLRLHAMAEAWAAQQAQPDLASLTFGSPWTEADVYRPVRGRLLRTTCKRGARAGADDRNARPMQARGGRRAGRLELVRSGRLGFSYGDARIQSKARLRP